MALFGHEEEYRGEVPEFECWCLFMKAAQGQPTVELVVPTGGSLARFNRGAGGLHHSGNFLCNFLSPIATRGVLVEYVQPL